MNTQSHRGFTIIEVMLFLAVSGALTIGILIGSSAVIGQQRYRDSVHTFKGLLQEQYGQVANVVNSESSNPACSRSGNSLAFDDSAPHTRGTSECLLLGKFILIESDLVTTHDVVGEPGAGIPDGGDTVVLQGYGFATRSPEEHPMSWGAKVVHPKTNDELTASVLIVRSPVSGAVLTYVQDGDHRFSVGGMVSDANMIQKDFCVESGGMSGMDNRLAVRINAYASNQSAVEVPLEADGICD